jgi:deoxyribodipyrimidine photolyase-related protein
MIFLIFPNQLFDSIKHLKNITKIYLIEEPRFFTDFKFHKLKLAYHRATMKKYYDKLKKKYNITYVNYYDVNNDFYKSLEECVYMDTIDNKLNDKLEKLLKNKTKIDTLNFLIKPSNFQDIKNIIFDKKYSHEKFYKYQRIKLDILMTKNKDKPIGNKWSYDTLNRLKIPSNEIIPVIKYNKVNKYIIEAKKYVEKYFSDNYGSLENFIYPIDHSNTIKWLSDFLHNRLINFGKYEDAVVDNTSDNGANSDNNNPFLFHSVLSPMMNIGLITDIEVVSISNEYYLQNTKKISIESYEGFIRQVIGWRNYVYLIYSLEGKLMFESNQLNHNNTINKKWWEGNLNILPVDNIIKSICKYGYAHHIERLMYLGNFMLLCNIHPQEAYRIFMEWTIDAYEWVMIPNVFGMSQYASDIMMTRPYFSSSNYIFKMSTYKKKDNEWYKKWDALYYSFINKHYKLLKSNYATARQAKHWTNKSKKEQNELIKRADIYLDKYIL